MAAIDYNYITSHNYFMSDFPFGNSSSFDLSDYILLDEGPVECLFPTSTEISQGPISPAADIGGGATSTMVASQLASGSSNNNNSVEGGGGGGGFRVAFRTKSEVEVLDDGFKWRKYGKKSVKNSPNPRNYYRCSTEGCSVKKRVERDRDDPSYVITTYDGIHNHMSADVVYYTTQDDISGQFVVSGCYGMPPSS